MQWKQWWQSLYYVGPWVLTQQQKENGMQVCQDLLNQHQVESDSFLDCIITGDYLEPKQQSMEWQPEFPIKVDAALSGWNDEHCLLG